MLELSEPPPGFTVIRADRDDYLIEYSQFSNAGKIIGCLFFATLWPIWTLMTFAISVKALEDSNDIDYFLLVLSVPFWAVSVLTPAGLPYSLFAKTRFGMRSQILTLNRSLLQIRRHQAFRREEIVEIRQIRDREKTFEDPETWALAIIGGTQFRILTHQSNEQIRWIGQILADWAGVG